MNWISENKFLAGFIAFMVVGVGVLGYLLFGAISDYGTIHGNYTTAVGQLDALQNKKPFPDQENLVAYDKEKNELDGVIENLEQDVSKIQLPLDPSITPQEFQAHLQAAVNDVNAKAKENHIDLPEKFALGFVKYMTAPPVPAAAPALDRELKAMQIFFDELLDGPGVAKISALPVRADLPEENPVEEKPAAPPVRGKPAPAKPSAPLVVKSAVQISFITSNDKLRKILNDLVETKKQFFIVDLVQIATAEGADKPIDKAEAAKTKTEKNGAPHLVLGNEKLDVTLSLQVVNFNLPQNPANPPQKAPAK